jgi:ribonuclease HII
LAPIVHHGISTNRITVCDSKVLFKSGGSIRPLETSVLAIVGSIQNDLPVNLQELAASLGFDVSSSDEREIWNFSHAAIPVASDPQQIRELADQFAAACANAQIELKAISARILFPRQFNKLINLHHNNKAELLSAQTIQCARQLACGVDEPIRFVCDKHGARNRYAAMINQFMTDECLCVEQESAAISSYAWHDGAPRQMQFVVKGESQFPVALASMVAKYIREVAMGIWNRFWLAQLPGLRPTQGYPSDARRFKRDIFDKQLELGISDESIWRTV